MKRVVQDVSSIEIEEKDTLDVPALLGPDWAVEKPTGLRLRVWSEDLERLVIEADNGLIVGLTPAPPGSFFAPTLDDDTSFKLLCSSCLHRYWPLYGSGPYRCPACGQRSDTYLIGSTYPFWYCASGMRLAVEKLEKRQERAPNLPGPAPEDMENFLKSQDFVATLVDWLDNYVAPLESNLQAWDMADRLEILFHGWKQARKPRRVGKRLSAFRALETAFNDEDWASWTRYPQIRTGNAYVVKVPKVKPEGAGEEPSPSV